MKPTILATALAGGVVGSVVTAFVHDGPAPVEASVRGEAALEGEGVIDLAQAIKESGAKGNLVCKAGVIDNQPKHVVYCTDGGTAGFLLADSVVASLGKEFDWVHGVLISVGPDGTIYGTGLAP